MLHTPGGDIAATHSLVHYLRSIFSDNIRTIVPQMAMSAGTMIACSCTEILLGKHSNIGPIDPHLRGIPAYGVIREFKEAYKDIKKDKDKLLVWQPILSKYEPAFLGQCEQAIEWSNQFVEEQLTQVMFKSKPNPKKLAKFIVKQLSDYRANKRHVWFAEIIAGSLPR